MRPYIIACRELLRRRNIQAPESGAEISTLVTALDLREEAMKIVSEIFAASAPNWLVNAPACPVCNARPTRDAIETPGQQYRPSMFRPLSVCNRPTT